MIGARGLVFSYGQGGFRAVDAVDLDLPAGGRAALVGRNGAGKSTLAKLICGLLTPDDGTVRLNGKKISDHSASERAALVSLAFQNPDNQLFCATVRQEVAFGPANLGLSEAEAEERTEQAIQEAGLTDVRERHPLELPFSRRRMVALASVLALRSRFLFLDEPTSGLDVRELAILEEILGRAVERGTGLAAVSHDMNFCARWFPRFVVLGQGRILRDDRAEKIFADEPLMEAAGLAPPATAALCRGLGLPGRALGDEEFFRLLENTRQRNNP